MFDQRISTHEASPLARDEAVNSVQSLLAALGDFANAGEVNTAPQHDVLAFAAPSLATRYAAANSITRRRFDAILCEADGVARTGMALIMGRADKHDAATIAAARFLGKTVAASLHKLENLLMPRSA